MIMSNILHEQHKLQVTIIKIKSQTAASNCQSLTNDSCLFAGIPLNPNEMFVNQWWSLPQNLTNGCLQGEQENEYIYG